MYKLSRMDLSIQHSTFHSLNDKNHFIFMSMSRSVTMRTMQTRKMDTILPTLWI